MNKPNLQEQIAQIENYAGLDHIMQKLKNQIA